jgi:hypothetical protein
MQSIAWSIKIEVNRNSQNKIDLQNLPDVVPPTLDRYDRVSSLTHIGV